MSCGKHTSTIEIDACVPEPELVEKAAFVVRLGSVVIFPTDTVYGIGMLATDSASLVQLYVAKQRPAEKSIPLLVSEISELKRLSSNVPGYAHELSAAYWPGALTLVVQASDKVSRQFVADDGSIALRMPDNPLTLALLKAAGAPLAASSANLSGKAPALAVCDLDPEVASAATLIIDGGRLAGGVPSTVVSCLEAEPQVLRPGPVTI